MNRQKYFLLSKWHPLGCFIRTLHKKKIKIFMFAHGGKYITHSTKTFQSQGQAVRIRWMFYNVPDNSPTWRKWHHGKHITSSPMLPTSPDETWTGWDRAWWVHTAAGCRQHHVLVSPLGHWKPLFRNIFKADLQVDFTPPCHFRQNLEI